MDLTPLPPSRQREISSRVANMRPVRRKAWKGHVPQPERSRIAHFPLNVFPRGDVPQLLGLGASTVQNAWYLQRTDWNVLDTISSRIRIFYVMANFFLFSSPEHDDDRKVDRADERTIASVLTHGDALSASDAPRPPRSKLVKVNAVHEF